MFTADAYRTRRARLASEMGGGVVLFLGNEEVGMNYTANVYPFRQDSSFLYFWAVDQPNLAAVMDLDSGLEAIVGDEATMADVVWSGPLPSLRDRAAEAGVETTMTPAGLQELLSAAVLQGRTVHYLAPYRPEHTMKLSAWLGIAPSEIKARRSPVMHEAIVAQRNYKTDAEVALMEAAVAVSQRMYAAAMATARPGRFEYEVVGAIAQAAFGAGATFAFPPICSVHGETLHNPHYGNQLAAGDVLVLDSGAALSRHYASDITRTIPVAGTFSAQQRLIYEMVLRAQLHAIAAVKPGVLYRDIHMAVARSFVVDLIAAGLMQGDPDSAVAAGAHALFFPHGLGHMIGLDVHDMENLGEDLVGYGPGQSRSSQFGLGYLRLARALEPGFVLTVEPGLYFIPALIDQWRADGTNASFLNFAEIDKFRDARGYRIEDDVLVTESGSRVLGPPIPKTVADVEAACAR